MAEQTRHTPGPWSIEWNGSGCDFITAPADGSDVWYIAQMCENVGYGADQSHANAHLVEAAPDLLTFAVAYLDLLNGDPNSRIDAALHEQARAAIAKATGGAQ